MASSTRKGEGRRVRASRESADAVTVGLVVCDRYGNWCSDGGLEPSARVVLTKQYIKKFILNEDNRNSLPRHERTGPSCSAPP